MTSVEIWKSSCDVSINGSVQSLFNFAYHTKLTRYKYTRNKIGRKTEIKRGKQKHGADILERATLYWSEWPGETCTSFSRFGILALYCSFTNMANFRRKTVIKLKGRNYPTVLRVSIEFPALFEGYQPRRLQTAIRVIHFPLSSLLQQRTPIMTITPPFDMDSVPSLQFY